MPSTDASGYRLETISENPISLIRNGKIMAKNAPQKSFLLSPSTDDLIVKQSEKSVVTHPIKITE